MPTTRILVNGALGRMGQITVKTLTNHPAFSVVGKTSRQDNLAAAIAETGAQVVVDFTRPEVVYANTLTIIKAGAHPVIGTTGLLNKQIQHLQALCKKLKRGGIIAPNFSIGMVLMMKYAQKLVKHFPQVEIIEMHHDGKKDSPSGTALLTAEKLASARPPRSTKKTPKSHETVPGARGATYLNIPIHAIRLPGLVAHEQILFGDHGETLSLRHDSTDRQCFMRGLVLACSKVRRMQRLVYGLEEVL
jgi:4-hydroxy-tetrahydrodipicolinate reductase